VSGNETFSEVPEETILLFSDTFISEVDEHNQRHNNVMINNTYAVLEGQRPEQDKIKFNWHLDSKKRPDTVFKPDLAYSVSGEWFWLMDGISLGSTIYIFALRLEENPDHIFNFNIKGVSLISTSLGVDNRLAKFTQIDTPLFYKGQSSQQDIVFGQAIMPLTKESCNPNPDGFIYIYGPRGSMTEKDMLVARVEPDSFSDIQKWNFWNGSKWSPQIEECASVTSDISQEFSMSPLSDGRFILVFQRGNNVCIRIGDSPVGPFGPIINIWDCHETDNDPDIYVYNAKAHPHLSKPGELLISYNVNCHTLERHDIEADLYRPRFIILNLESGVINVD